MEIIKQHLLIRADADFKMGIGHMMRCIALAQAWKAKGGKVTFISICENDSIIKKIKDEGFSFIPLQRSFPSPADLHEVTAFIRRLFQKHRGIWCVLDGYHFDTKYQKALLSTQVKLMVLDDYHHLDAYHAHIILNQNIDAEKIQYVCDFDAQRLLGLKYTLLRTEYLDLQRKAHAFAKPIQNILVTLGGSDYDNATVQVIQALLNSRFKNITIHLVVGPYNPNKMQIYDLVNNSLKNYSERLPNFVIHKNANMPTLISSADLCISAGGSTCWELCYLGIPFIVIITAKNQQNIAVGLQRARAALCAGWANKIFKNKIQKNLVDLINDVNLRENLSKAANTLIDGKGRLRVIQKMLKL